MSWLGKIFNRREKPEWLNKSETWEEADARIPPHTVNRVLGKYKNAEGEWVKLPVVDKKKSKIGRCLWCGSRFEDIRVTNCQQCGAPNESKVEPTIKRVVKTIFNLPMIKGGLAGPVLPYKISPTEIEYRHEE